jgi:hypothetical protein
VVADQPELLALRVDGGLVVERAVLEMKYEAAGHLIAAGSLDQIAVGHPFSVERLQAEEAVDQPLGVSDGHCLACQRAATEKGNAGDQPREAREPTMKHGQQKILRTVSMQERVPQTVET